MTMSECKDTWINSSGQSTVGHKGTKESKCECMNLSVCTQCKLTISWTEAVHSSNCLWKINQTSFCLYYMQPHLMALG